MQLLTDPILRELMRLVDRSPITPEMKTRLMAGMTRLDGELTEARREPEAELKRGKR